MWHPANGPVADQKSRLFSESPVPGGPSKPDTWAQDRQGECPGREAGGEREARGRAERGAGGGLFLWLGGQAALC